jgi:hypothetical protein
MMKMMQVGLYPYLGMFDFDSLLCCFVVFLFKTFAYVKLFDLYYSVSRVLLRPLGE